MNRKERKASLDLTADWPSVRRLFIVLLAGFIMAMGSSRTLAQINAPDVEPPPLKFVSKDELAALDAVSTVKKRTKLALDLMDARLAQAEAFGEKQEYEEMFKTLGRFHGLMDNTLAFLDDSDRNSGKVLNNYKRFEIGLRKFRPRLELMRRDLPSRYEPYVKNLLQYLRDARSKAVKPLFGNSVVEQPKS